MIIYKILIALSLNIFLHSVKNAKSLAPSIEGGEEKINELEFEISKIRIVSVQLLAKKCLSNLTIIKEKYKKLIPVDVFQKINEKINSEKKQLEISIEEIEDPIIREEVKTIKCLLLKRLIIKYLKKLMPIPAKYSEFFPSDLFPCLNFLIRVALYSNVKTRKSIFEFANIHNEIERLNTDWKNNILFCLSKGIFLPNFFKLVLPKEFFPILNCFINSTANIKLFKLAYQNNPYAWNPTIFIGVYSWKKESNKFYLLGMEKIIGDSHKLNDCINTEKSSLQDNISQISSNDISDEQDSCFSN